MTFLILIMSLFDWKPEIWDKKYLAPELLNTNYNYQLISDEKGFGIYTFPLFSQLFCDELKTNLQSFNDWTENRHKHYPTNDILLKDYNKSLYTIYDCIIRNIILPATNILFTEELNEKKLTHETFIVRYTPDKQGHLSLHNDNSVFSVITTLSAETDYEGGGTLFSKQKLLLKSPAGTVTIHPGRMTHRHGVRPIIGGTRYVIVSFVKCN